MILQKNYNKKHYLYYKDKFHSDINNLDIWIKSLSKNELKIWLRLVALLKNNIEMHYHNSIISLTFILKLYLNELDISHDLLLSLNDDIINKVINRFYISLSHQYMVRKDGIKINNNLYKYTLLKDISW